uniref:GH39 family glycosyl hydrolase n=1 Tax=uncultured Draconibacterium sp. TaxID=1573823 RepID=UPI0032165065
MTEYKQPKSFQNKHFRHKPIRLKNFGKHKTLLFLLIILFGLYSCKTKNSSTILSNNKPEKAWNSLSDDMVQPLIFEIRADSILGKNTQFWKASGTDLLYALAEKSSGQALLDRMAAKNSCTYLRNHYTLSRHIREGVEVGIHVYSEDENGNPVYDFSRVNRIYGEFVRRGLKPVVECDYMPLDLQKRTKIGNISNDENMGVKNAGPDDWNKWHNLLVAFTKNLVETFGVEEVRTWYFEVWNEPDGWKHTDISTFYKLYDVFVDAVKSVDSGLKVGGPACYHEWFMKEFLDHVVYGTNFVTGETGTRIDFISYHIYGLSGSWLNNEPRIKPQVQRFTQSVLWMSRLLKKYKILNEVEFHINEWGMSSHYQKTVTDYPDLEYRNSEESALFLVKLVDCLYAIEDNYNFPTNMLLYWGGAWEAEKGEFFMGHRTLTTAGNIPKPILTAYEMLALLGENRIAVHGPRKGNRIGIIASSTINNEIKLLAYNYNETDDDLSLSDTIEINISGLVNRDYIVEEYNLDRDNHNTYRAWQEMKSPKLANNTIIDKLQKVAELTANKTYERNIKNQEVELSLVIPRHSMTLISLKENRLK